MPQAEHEANFWFPGHLLFIDRLVKCVMKKEKNLFSQRCFMYHYISQTGGDEKCYLGEGVK